MHWTKSHYAEVMSRKSFSYFYNYVVGAEIEQSISLNSIFPERQNFLIAISIETLRIQLHVTSPSRQKHKNQECGHSKNNLIFVRPALDWRFYYTKKKGHESWAFFVFHPDCIIKLTPQISFYFIFDTLQRNIRNWYRFASSWHWSMPSDEKFGRTTTTKHFCRHWQMQAENDGGDFNATNNWNIW